MSEEKKSEAPKERTLQDIQQEFANLCSKAGYIQYQKQTHESDLAAINGVLRDLNIEAANLRVKQAETEAAKAKEEATKLEAAKAEENKTNG